MEREEKKKKNEEGETWKVNLEGRPVAKISINCTPNLKFVNSESASPSSSLLC